MSTTARNIRAKRTAATLRRWGRRITRHPAVFDGAELSAYAKARLHAPDAPTRRRAYRGDPPANLTIIIPESGKALPAK
jgi:hypothetical protein